MQSTNAKCLINVLKLTFKTHGYLQYLRNGNRQPLSASEFQGCLTLHGIVQVKAILYWYVSIKAINFAEVEEPEY